MRFLMPFLMLAALAGCRTYDQSMNWVPGEEEGPVSIELEALERGVARLSISNNGTEEQLIDILPQSSIIGYRKYLSSPTGLNPRPGHLRGESRVVRSAGGSHYSESRSQDIYGSFTLSRNGFILEPGETTEVDLKLGNWNKATENFISRVYVLISEGDLRTRMVMQVPAEYFFNNSVTSYGSSGFVNMSGSLRFRF